MRRYQNHVLMVGLFLLASSVATASDLSGQTFSADSVYVEVFRVV